jgi:hypothetical protein
MNVLLSILSQSLLANYFIISLLNKLFRHPDEPFQHFILHGLLQRGLTLISID